MATVIQFPRPPQDWKLILLREYPEREILEAGSEELLKVVARRPDRVVRVMREVLRRAVKRNVKGLPTNEVLDNVARTMTELYPDALAEVCRELEAAAQS